uniref:BHLH domain-containing protein n=1 Tax=Syphacia muris TaxID=451379 RepID=A0A0N5B0A6_9BILA
MNIRLWLIIQLMTTFATAFYLRTTTSANSQPTVDDGQLATTSDSQNIDFDPNSDNLTDSKNVVNSRSRRSSLRVLNDGYTESIDIPLLNNIKVSEEYRQRHRAKTRMRMKPPERIDPGIRSRRRLQHRQHMEQLLKKLLRELRFNKATIKSSGTEEINEDLCATERRIVQMNDLVYKFYPSFYEEVYCKSDLRSRTKPVIQVRQDLYFTRIRRNATMGDVHVVKNVAVGCQAMWPADQWGHQEL